MALRVLLADESTTIKKVILLALQDFAVEVKAVHIGIDVLEIAKTYQPDIFFVDILLQKRNGYEVAADVKRQPQFANTPLVLMWSSFMELDEKQASESGADRRLEKPFDVDQLRKLVLELVPRLQSQPLAAYLTFGPGVTEPLKQEEFNKRQQYKPPPTPPPLLNNPETSQTFTPPPLSLATMKPPPITPPPVTANTNTWSMDSFEDIEKFATQEPDPWSQKDLGKFKLNLHDVTIDSDDFEVNIGLDTNDKAADVEDASDDDIDEFTVTPVGAAAQNPFVERANSKAAVPLPSAAQLARASSSDAVEMDASVEMTASALMAEGLEIEAPNTPVSGGQEFEPGEELPLPGNLGYLEMSIEGVEETNNDGLELEANPRALRAEDIMRVRDEVPMPEEAADPSFAVKHSQAREQEAQEATLDLGHGLIAEQHGLPQVSADRLEAMVRAQSLEVIEEMVRRVVPELAEKLIRQELERLLEEQQ